MSEEFYKTKKATGTERQNQQSFTTRAKSHKKMEVIGTPDIVLTAAQATAGIKVGKGSICRIFGVATDLVGFYSSIPGAVPAVTDQTVCQLGATVTTIIASDSFIRTTSGVTRVEVTTLGEAET